MYVDNYEFKDWMQKLLDKLEQYTLELVKTNRQIITFTKQFEASYKEEGIISVEK